MTLEILVKYLHFICIFGIVGSLVGEHLLLKKTLSRNEIQRLAKIDGIYGLSALLLLGAGFTLWFWVGKPASYYSNNWVFHLKLGCYVLVGILSIYPTIFFAKQRKGNPSEEIQIPKAIFWMIRFELLLVFIMPVLATLMAKGIGRF